MKTPSHKRHLLKALTWRIVGTVDTIILATLVTGMPLTGLKIGVTEVLTKMLLYYFHERIWIRVHVPKSRQRHLYKTISWRAIGTLDTMLISFILTGDALVGLTIGGLEIFTKMILYYVHERVWYRVPYGLEKLDRKTHG